MADGDSGKGESLKQKNFPYLAVYVMAHILALCGIAMKAPLSGELIRSLGALDWSKVAWSLVTGPIALLLNGLAGSNFKASLVFGRVKDPLPSSRFVTMLGRDPRIDIERLKSKLDGGFPTSPKQQTVAWYKLYRKHESNPSVRANHQEFLLLRDVAWLSLLLTVLGGASLLASGSSFRAVASYVAISLMLFFLFAAVAQQAANRFVLTVLASESAAAEQQDATAA